MADLPRAVALTTDGPVVDRVRLIYDARHRRRLRLVAEGGLELLLDLAEARHLRDGDRLLLEDGRVVLVEAAAEPVLEVRAASPVALARLAWHLGNRHTPTQILEGILRVRPDHVLADMLRQLGAEVSEREAPFDPEGGAYAAGGHGGHGRHGHPHD